MGKQQHIVTPSKKTIKHSQPIQKWHHVSIRNSARKDAISKVKHWEKQQQQETQDYAFASLNKTISIIQYTPEEYDRILQNKEWTRQQTDELFDLCKQFDL